METLNNKHRSRQRTAQTGRRIISCFPRTSDRISLRPSAYLCDLCVYGHHNAEIAEGRRASRRVYLGNPTPKKLVDSIPLRPYTPKNLGDSMARPKTGN